MVLRAHVPPPCPASAFISLSLSFPVHITEKITVAISEGGFNEVNTHEEFRTGLGTDEAFSKKLLYLIDNQRTLCVLCLGRGRLKTHCECSQDIAESAVLPKAAASEAWALPGVA